MYTYKYIDYIHNLNVTYYLCIRFLLSFDGIELVVSLFATIHCVIGCSFINIWDCIS